MNPYRLILPTCVAIISGFVATSATAAGVAFELELDSEAIGDASASFFIFKNGSLLGSENQIIELDVGDSLSIQIEVVARGMTDASVSAFGDAFLFGGLVDPATGAEVHARYSARVDARGDDAFSSAGFVYACVTFGSCFPGGLPFGDAAIISDTFAGNAEVIDDEFMPLPGFGGVLEQMVDQSFSLSPGGPVEATILDLAVFGDTGMFDNGDSAGAAFVTLDIEVGIIPIPAAVWLFGSALGLLGLARRRSR
jgi:hypothetical protein